MSAELPPLTAAEIRTWVADCFRAEYLAGEAEFARRLQAAASDAEARQVLEAITAEVNDRVRLRIPELKRDYVGVWQEARHQLRRRLPTDPPSPGDIP